MLELLDIYKEPVEIFDLEEVPWEQITARFGPSAKAPPPLKYVIKNARDAANHMACNPFDRQLRTHIDCFLDRSNIRHSWRQSMPSVTPKEIAKYQKSHSSCDFDRVSHEIDELGKTLSVGQCIFHAGVYPKAKDYKTDKPLSTTLCPDVALRNFEFKAKAYDAGCIDLYVLEVAEPRTNVFIFKRKGTKLGHENEILFSAGARLTFKSRNLVREDYEVAKLGSPNKQVPIYLVHALIS